MKSVTALIGSFIVLALISLSVLVLYSAYRILQIPTTGSSLYMVHTNQLLSQLRLLTILSTIFLFSISISFGLVFSFFIESVKKDSNMELFLSIDLGAQQ